MNLKVQTFKMYAWLVFGIATLVLVLIYRAWHHLPTIGLSAAMDYAYRGDVESLKAQSHMDAGKAVRNNTHTH